MVFSIKHPYFAYARSKTIIIINCTRTNFFNDFFTSFFSGVRKRASDMQCCPVCQKPLRDDATIQEHYKYEVKRLDDIEKR